MHVHVTYRHTLVQEFNVSVDAAELASALGIGVDELLALSGPELDARLEAIHYAMANDPEDGDTYEDECSSFLEEHFEQGDLYEDDEAGG